MDNFEIRRKAMHIVVGIILALGITYNIFSSLLLEILLLVGAGVSTGYYYYYNIKQTKNPFWKCIHWFLVRFDRAEHREQFPGKSVLFFIAGALLTSLLFEKAIVVAGILILTFGDSVGAIVGKHSRKIIHPLHDHRSLDGTIAGIIVATLAAALVVPFTYALSGAIIAMILESIEFQIYGERVDDNILIPLVASTCIFILTIL